MRPAGERDQGPRAQGSRRTKCPRPKRLLADDHQEPVVPIPHAAQVEAVHVSTTPVLVHAADDQAVRVGLDDAVDRDRRVRGHFEILEVEGRDSDVAAGAPEVTAGDLVDHLLVGGILDEVVRRDPRARHRAPVDVDLEGLREALEVGHARTVQKSLEGGLGDRTSLDLRPEIPPLTVSDSPAHLVLHSTDNPAQQHCCHHARYVGKQYAHEVKARLSGKPIPNLKCV